MEEKVQLLQEKVNLSNDIISQSNDTICNELTAASDYFASGSVMIAIIAVILGIYLTHLTKKVKNIQEEASAKIEYTKKLLDQITEKETKISEIENHISQMSLDVENLDHNIRTDVRGISDLFRKEDTAALLDRLIVIPEDIVNVSHQLTSRDIEKALFPKMKEAYRNLKKSDEYDNCRGYYHLLFFQHFFGDAICDDEISSSLTDSIPDCIHNAWAVDMCRSTYNLVQKLTDKPNPQRDISILSEYITQVESSRHANNKEIYEIITRDISNDTLKNIWSNLSNREPKPVNFGKQLIRYFSPNNDPAFVRSVALALGLSHERYN